MTFRVSSITQWKILQKAAFAAARTERATSGRKAGREQRVTAKIRHFRASGTFSVDLDFSRASKQLETFLTAAKKQMKLTADGSVPADRSRFVAVQTPQVFRSEILRKAYAQSYDTSFTDDLTVVQKAGFPVKIVDGLRYNIKITTPDDLRLAEALL